MATRETTLAAILANLRGHNIRAAKMFGEYTLYCDEKVVALIADDQFFLKITPSSEEVFDARHEAPPYPGAKLHYRIPEERIQDAVFMTEIVNRVAADLPAPKPRKRR